MNKTKWKTYRWLKDSLILRRRRHIKERIIFKDMDKGRRSLDITPYVYQTKHIHTHTQKHEFIDFIVIGKIVLRK